MILYADDVSFSVMTPEGHPEAGFNTFSARGRRGDDLPDPVSGAGQRPDLRAGLPADGWVEQQEAIWRHVLTQLSKFGVAARR